MSEMSDANDASVAPIAAVVDRLLGEDGCPWDREQTLETMRPYVLEEAFEVVESIDSGRPEAIREELGDLLFLVTFLARLTRARYGFGLADVATTIAEKMIRRHPWVFAGQSRSDGPSALAGWEAQKAAERREKGRLSGVPAALPALLRAFRVGEKAAAVGYDFQDAAAARAKVDEERRELDDAIAAGDAAGIQHELGDLLFAVANHGRKLGVDPETALRLALDRFSQRFHACEETAKAEGLDLARLDDSARDRLWNAAKAKLAATHE